MLGWQHPCQAHAIGLLHCTDRARFLTTYHFSNGRDFQLNLCSIHSWQTAAVGDQVALHLHITSKVKLETVERERLAS